jgi:hypothetical protein
MIFRRRRCGFGKGKVSLCNTNLFNECEDSVSLSPCSVEGVTIGRGLRGSCGLGSPEPGATDSQFGHGGFVRQPNFVTLTPGEHHIGITSAVIVRHIFLLLGYAEPG